jgi:putative hemolysin
MSVRQQNNFTRLISVRRPSMSESASASPEESAAFKEALVAEKLVAIRAPRRYLDDDGVLCVSGDFRARLAMNAFDRDAAFRLRYEIFNVELGKGLPSAHRSGRDTDEFDHVCEHILVEEIATSRIVGTYRLQHGAIAGTNLGYYSAREFDFTPYEPFRNQMLELGRACIDVDFRTMPVLMLLWRGICSYAQHLGARYMIGCSSLTTQDVAAGSDMYHALSRFLVEEQLRTQPAAGFSFPLQAPPLISPDPPKLLKSYLTIGSRICGTPAIDRDFGTIDFLTFIDLERLAPSMKLRLLK